VSEDILTCPPAADGVATVVSSRHLSVNAGLPPLCLGDKPTSFFEFWPAWLMYFPVALYWMLLAIRYRSLGLPLVVNPEIPLGGMIGESKNAIFSQAGEHLRAALLPHICVERIDIDVNVLALQALQRAKIKGLEFPLVAKPDVGCRGAQVELVENLDQLRQFFSHIATGSIILLQALAPYKAEAGIFYIRYPTQNSGHIASLTLKYRPVVIGDGVATVEQLIRAHPRASKLSALHCKKNRHRLNDVPAKGEEFALEFAGSHCRGSVFRNGNEYISAEMERVFDSLLQDLPRFFYGRLDIKFESIEKLQQGRCFRILEINGVSSEQTHIWDSRTTLKEALAVLLGQYRCLFEIGDQLRAKGFAVPSVFAMIRTWLLELRRS